MTSNIEDAYYFLRKIVKTGFRAIQKHIAVTKVLDEANIQSASLSTLGLP
jgi:hypothetical protein